MAKVLWMGLGLVCLGGSLFLMGRHLRVGRKPILLLTFGILFTTYYPLLTYLERGQIDAINLLLLTGAILMLLTPTRRKQLVAGLLIALATLFKLQCAYFVPFLLWRRQWWAIVGYGVGGILLVSTSLWLNGTTSISNYIRVEMPRIAQYGDLGAPEQFMDRADWQKLHADAPDGYTIKDSRFYLPESFFFTKNSTTVRNLHSIWTKLLGTGVTDRCLV